MAWGVTRRAQSVVPFGIGSIVEFEDEALMAAGLDAWPEVDRGRLYDDRLARRLGVNHFRLPPPKPDRDGVPGTMAPLPYVRFPQWHFCPRCRALKKADLFAAKRPRCDNADTSPRPGQKAPCASRPERSRPAMLPLRFIAVCPAGHVEDFPWDAWAHSEAKQGLSREGGCGKGSLYFYATKRGGLSGLIVSCGGCGRKRSLMGSTNPQGLKGLQCRGNRPWLGKDAAEICNAPPGRGGVRQMLALQRGASNLYFPEVASSILIPPYSSKIRQLISDRQIIEALESGLENGRIPTSAFRAVAKLHRVDARQLEEAYYARGGNSTDAGSSDETAFRHHEYFALLQERRERDDALSCRPRELSRYAAIVRNFFENVTLVEKLTETRALTSFSRIRPGASGGHNLSLAPVSWLPAFRVTGEGVFLTLNAERLRVFERAEGSRLAPLLERARAYNRSPLPVSSRLVLVHTLAHLLIKRLSFEAGYGASSIRERVYSSVEPSSQPMAGILLYTAAGDADGTLGGLVGLGAPGMLERAVAGALEDARWCASDPICAESKGQGPDSLNLAACHACALLPETSCEFQNRLLDRAAVTRYFEGGATRW